MHLQATPYNGRKKYCCYVYDSNISFNNLTLFLGALKKIVKMKLFLCCLFASILAIDSRLVPLFHNENPIPNEYVVVLENNIDVASFLKVAAQRITRQSFLRKTIDRNILKAAVFELDEQSLEEVRTIPGIKRIEENGIYRITKGANTWGLDRIDQRSGINGYFTLNSWGAGQEIYIIDTGIRPTHQEFEDRGTALYDTVGDGNGPVDCHGHGTHCAGTAAGKTYGVASKAQVFGVRVFDCTGSGSLAQILDGISYVVDATIGKSVVLSMSLGGSKSLTMNALIRDAVNGGDVVVAAAGNEFRDACRSSPASEPMSITVGAIEKGDRKAPYSNHGPCVDILAPGSSIKSAWDSSDTATATISGTSMATPHVAGGAAVLMEQGLPSYNISTYLTSTATPDAIDMGELGADDTPNLLLYLE